MKFDRKFCKGRRHILARRILFVVRGARWHNFIKIETLSSPQLPLQMCYGNIYTLTVWEWHKPLEDNQVLPPIPNRREVDDLFPMTLNSKWIIAIKFFSGGEELYKRVLYFNTKPPAFDPRWLFWWERNWYALQK